MRPVNRFSLSVVLCALCSTAIADSNNETDASESNEANLQNTVDASNGATIAIETLENDHESVSNDLEHHIQGVATALLKTLAGATGVMLDSVIDEVSLDTSTETANEEFARHIEKYDANNDGALSFDEWANFSVDDLPASFKELSEEERAERIATDVKFADSNKDGKITHAEMIRALERIEKIAEFAQALKTYSGVDEDNDLLLDFDSLLDSNPEIQDTLNQEFEDRNSNDT